MSQKHQISEGPQLPRWMHPLVTPLFYAYMLVVGGFLYWSKIHAVFYLLGLGD